MRLTRSERHRRLSEALTENPLQTDEELAHQLDVSVPTIRLDRLYLGIPELRLRTQGLAQQVVQPPVGTLLHTDMVGQLVDREPGRWGSSVLDTVPSMEETLGGHIRGHFLYAQAETLAAVIMEPDSVVTGLANIKFKRPVATGARLVAYGEVIRRHQRRNVVLVVTRCDADIVFRGKFVLFGRGKKGDEAPCES